MSAPLPLRMIAAEIEDIAGRLTETGGPKLHEMRDHLAVLAEQVRTHAGYEPTEHDHRMIHHAKARGKVRLRNGDLVTLTSWRVKGARDRARVVRSEASGPFSVPIDEIAEVINPTPTPKEVDECKEMTERRPSVADQASAADDFPELIHIAEGRGVMILEDAETQAAMALAEIDVLRRRVALREAELAATVVALRMAGYDGALTR